MPTTHLIALGVTALYGVVTLVGGIIGYVQKGSMPSLLAGGISGVLLLLCAAGVFYRPAVSLSGAIVIAVALLGKFVPDLLRQPGQWSETLTMFKAMVQLIMVVGGVLVIIVSALALATRAKPPSVP